MSEAEVVLEAQHVTRHYPVRGRASKEGGPVVHAVDDVSLELRSGETLGIVGESGCGKSTLAKALALLDRPTSGEILVGGAPTSRLKERGLRRLRCDVQMVFQDPHTSLNPRLTVGAIVREPLDAQRGAMTRRDRDARVRELLEMVGLKPEFARRYPHQFSGGQRQRIGIARALALSPRVVVCDEATSALDVSVQAQIINLLSDLKERLGVAFVFVSHDLGLVRQICDHVAVMYLGKVCETGTVTDVLDDPRHPYTAALLSASLDPDEPTGRSRIVLRGEPPTPVDPPHGCRFHTRCWRAQDQCKIDVPVLSIGDRPSTAVSCHLPGPPYDDAVR